MAVAGTRRDEPGAAARLAGSAKDLEEHQAVVEDLLVQLARWGRAVPRPSTVRRFGGLHHLVTEIELAPEASPDFEALVRALHPTPALGVWPRGDAGDAWLRGIDEAGARRRFGAPFGVRWPSGTGRSVVAIRNVQCHDGHLEIWAGCGVVPASRYGEEWQEVQDKIAAVRTSWNL
jgi:menaquinone-specific isochorismate synthase